MQVHAASEWPLSIIHCLNEALSPYYDQNLASGTRLPEKIRDIINLFVHLVLAAFHESNDGTRFLTKTKTQQAWQALCLAQLQRTRVKGELESGDLNRLMRIEIEELRVLISKNMVFYDAPPMQEFCNVIRRWLIGCARTNLTNSFGNALKETFDRMTTLQTSVLKPASIITEVKHTESSSQFPELTHTLGRLRPDQPQLEDCIKVTLQYFLKVTFTALDIYRFYRPHKDDPTPCKCQLDSTAMQCIQRLDFRPERTIRFPTYLFWVLGNVNQRGSFNFLLMQIIPSLYHDQPNGDGPLLGFRLYQWFIDAARNLDMDMDAHVADGIHAVLSRTFDPEATPVTDRQNFRPRALLPSISMHLLDQAGVAHTTESAYAAHNNSHGANGAQFDDVVIVVPCGPVIDLARYSSVVAVTATPSNSEEKEEEVEQVCAICRDALSSEKCLVQLHICKHVYHAECMAGWMNTRTTTVTCPICRTAICAPRATRRACLRCEYRP